MSKEITSFVRAIWSDLIVVSYAVPDDVSDDVLQPLLPPGLVLDRWQGQTHVSLVAFRFHSVRVLGLPAPAPFGNFPQWNLRFYVRPAEGQELLSENERGIVFIREFVPTLPIAMTVHGLYGEPYQAAPLSCRVTPVGNLRRVRYDLDVDGHRRTLAVSGLGPAVVPTAGSAEAFFTGQGWGFARGRGETQRRFRVTHPPWRVYAIQEWDVTVDFEHLYGKKWAFLQEIQPDSVVLCEGSAVGVSGSLRGNPALAPKQPIP